MIEAPRLQAPSLSAVAGLRHGFFTRHGGVSEGAFASLNCAAADGDAPDHVAENRRRVCGTLDIDEKALVTAAQVHGARASAVTGPWPEARPEAGPEGEGEAPQLDAMATSTPGVALGLLTADCAPVLMVDTQARVIGAAHAGWRGALAGVLEAAVSVMAELGAAPANIVAAIGPAIGPNSYDVGAEFPAPFLAQDAANATHFSDASGHLRFDLPGYIGSRLRGAGVQVRDLGQDTCAEPQFFSYRRNLRAGTGPCGRQLSVIALAPG